jgi:hypothetical protein
MPLYYSLRDRDARMTGATASHHRYFKKQKIYKIRVINDIQVLTFTWNLCAVFKIKSSAANIK